MKSGTVPEIDVHELARKLNSDELFVLLDKSLSMVEEIDSVKEYVADNPRISCGSRYRYMVYAS